MRMNEKKTKINDKEKNHSGGKIKKLLDSAERIGKKKIMAVSGIIFIIIASLIFLIFFSSEDDPLPLKKEKITIEYGKSIPLVIKDYIDTDKLDMNKNELKDHLMHIKISTNAKNEIVTSTDESGNEIRTEKDYPATGKYKVKLTYNKNDTKETKTVEVTVKDTVKPKFTEDFKTSLDITRDCQPKAEDLASMFSADDLSEVTIKVDDSKVDYSKTGEYKASVTAADSSKNKAKKETVIKIIDPTISFDKTSETVYVNADTFFKATITGKDQAATWTSSDSSVATVNEEGKVTGKKVGTATITAEANGVSAQATVTVKAQPSGSKTTKKTVTNPTTGKQETVTVVEQSPSNSGGSSSASASISMDAFNYINQERQKLGLNPCQYDSRLGAAAKVRAQELATKFSHTRPNGTTCGTAVTEAGYPTRGNGYGIYGFQECIGMNYYSSYSIVYDGWKTSAGHWNALMNSGALKMAVARYGNYWVAMVIHY